MILKISRCISACVPALALILLFSTIVLAQGGAAVRGLIMGRASAEEPLKPVEGATIEVYRIDVDQDKPVTTKTDKKGQYYQPLQALPNAEYAVAVSAPGFSPLVSIRFKVGGEQPVEQSFDMVPGDGSKPTPEQVRAVAKQFSVGATADDIKKAREEAAKELKEREKKNEEIRKANAKSSEMKKYYDEGVALNGKKDYENAIKQFKEAANIASEMSDNAKNQSVIYANLALALYNFGAIRFNNKQKDEAKGLFVESAQYAEKAIGVDPNSAEFHKIYGDSCDILCRNLGAPEYADKAIKAYTTSAGFETDNTKKGSMLAKIGNIYFSLGDVDKSMEAFDKVLAIDANNLEALNGKALVLSATGEKPKMEEAVKLYQRVIEKAPAGSKTKQEAEENMQYLAETLKIEVKKDPKKKK